MPANSLHGGVLHLVVHREQIEETVHSSLVDCVHRAAYQQVLKRLDEVEQLCRPLKKIVWDADSLNDDIHQVVDLCSGYETVILYGIARCLCLQYAARKLIQAGFSVAYDIQGTID